MSNLDVEPLDFFEFETFFRLSSFTFKLSLLESFLDRK